MKKIPKRPKLARKTEYSDSMASCASQLKVQIEILEFAKREGCKAFRGSRVYHKPLKKWLDANQSRVEGILKDSEIDRRKREAEAKFKEHRVSMATKETIKKTDAKRDMVTLISVLRKHILSLPGRTSAKLALMTNQVNIESYLDAEIATALLDSSKSDFGKLECPYCKKEIA